jgi:hypothetical protein
VGLPHDYRMVGAMTTTRTQALNLLYGQPENNPCPIHREYGGINRPFHDCDECVRFYRERGGHPKTIEKGR